MGNVKIIKSGLFSSLQSTPVFEAIQDGVPVGGTMSLSLASTANKLVGSKEEATVLELLNGSISLEFDQEAQVAVVGEGVAVYINQKLQVSNRNYLVNSKNIITIEKPYSCALCYISIVGGFVLDKKVNVTERLCDGNQLAYNSGTTMPLSQAIMPKYNNKIEVCKSVDFGLVSDAVLDQILDTKFTRNAQSNRMAFLVDEVIEKHAFQVKTRPVIPGAIQWTPSGSLVLLMRDCQTTGGYPYILQITDDGMEQLANIPVGGSFEFILI